jgi:hypothetical protein
MVPNYKFARIQWLFNIATMFNTSTPNPKFPVEGDRKYAPSPYNPPVEVRYVGRPSGYDYNIPYPPPDDNTMNYDIVRNFPPDPISIHS